MIDDDDGNRCLPLRFGIFLIRMTRVICKLTVLAHFNAGPLMACAALCTLNKW